MRKKTAPQNPGNRKASPKQTKGLVAKGRKPGESAKEKCVLDNRSHRTPRGLAAQPPGCDPEPPSCSTVLLPKRVLRRRAVSDSEPALGPLLGVGA
jgi:hypothetical protein